MNTDKIELLKDTIEILYTKEGKSLNYISNLLKINRKGVTKKVKEWGFVSPRKHLVPSKQKFLNKNKDLIRSMFENNYTQKEIAYKLNISERLLKEIIDIDENLKKIKEQSIERNRIKNAQKGTLARFKDKPIIDLENEEWKQILGYETYYISNYGRVKRKINDVCYQVKGVENKYNHRIYIGIMENGHKKNLQIARLVGFAFVNGYNETCNTINHKDGNVQNNCSDNLEWTTQEENNTHAYRILHRNVVNKRKYKFAKIRYKHKYEFKTIIALARFMGKSETQVRRYIEDAKKYEIELIK